MSSMLGGSAEPPAKKIRSRGSECSPADVMTGEMKDSADTMPGDKIDKLYFDGYASLTMHRIMLEDEVRTNSYRDAIDERFREKTVLDVGCGTGVLSIFAAKAGAKKVYAVDGCARIAKLAKDMMQANGLENVVEVINCKVEELQLPEKVDIIVSEWMGYFLIYESMFQSVIAARDKWLKPGGLMLPERCVVKAVPFTNQDSIDETRSFWDSKPYEIDYGIVARDAVISHYRAPVIECLPDPSCQLARPEILWDFDCKTISVADLSLLNSKCSFKSIANGQFHGICVWFDCHFGGSKNVILTTGPDDEVTHWYQTCLYTLPETDRADKGQPVNEYFVRQDEVLDAEFEVKPNGRSLNVSMGVKVKDTDWIRRKYLLDPSDMSVPTS